MTNTEQDAPIRLHRAPMSTLLASYMALLVLLTTGIFTAFFFHASNRSLLRQIDDKLYAAAHFAKATLPDDYHDRIHDVSSVTPEAFTQIVDRNNQLCQQLDLQYLWSCMILDDQVVFTTSTSPGKDVRVGDHAGFLDIHSDPNAFDTAFGQMEVDYTSFHNEWGSGRSVLVPFRDSHGRRFCFGASMSIGAVLAAQRHLLLNTFFLGVGVIVLAFLGTLILARRVNGPIQRLTASAERLAQNDLDVPVDVKGPREIEQLSHALDAMRLAIRSHVATLRDREEEQRLLLQNLKMGIVIHDPDTRIVYSNPMATTLLGLSTEQMQGKEAVDPAWAFLRDDGSTMAIEEFPVNCVLTTKESLTDYIVGVRRPDLAETTWVLVNAFPEFGEDRAIRRVVIAFADVSEVRRLEKRLVHAQKMEAIGQLAGGIAHDFNNILQAISGYTELASDDTPADHPAQSSLDQVSSAAARAATLVSQLLSFSRRQVIDPTCIDLNDVTANAIGMIERLIGEHIQLTFVPGHQLGTVCADQTMLDQVLINLCVNARDAMPDGGRLTIETENVFLDNEYCEQNIWARPGRYVLLSVTDTGVGMDDDTIERIFDPFYTTKETGKGTGLGLSTVYGAIRQHEGMARVYSEVDKGTTFKLYLPVVERAVDDVGTKIAGLPPGGTETILIAEDDESLRALATSMLTRAGYSVLAAADGQEALDLFSKNTERVQLLLLDVVMPRIGGREVFERIRKAHPTMPALFASGYSENAIHTNFVLDEGMELIRKPYVADDLLRHIRTILDGTG